MNNTLQTRSHWKAKEQWGYIKIHSEEEGICSIHGLDKNSRSKACLIAAAPDLLLALETLLSDRSCPRFLTLDEWRNKHPEFRETLRKAKGEA
jgi:hypothetical protein